MDNEGSTWENWVMYETCGVNNSSELTMKVLENHIEKILLELDWLKEGIDREDNSYATFAIGYQVLALYLLEAGAYVPEVVKGEVLFSTTFEYDKRWRGGGDPDSYRIEFLNQLRNAVVNQVPGKKYEF
ncbi:hypothetical protein LCGC14_1293730 [marine sediment metagenome]|uniref:Uncharacterized protein n=1 Tax=marine sediment metagenome TaxID=412755 RepID=A0A0F9N872_9ZZZZ